MIKIIDCKNKNYIKKLNFFLEKRKVVNRSSTDIAVKIVKDIKKNNLKALTKYEKKFSKNSNISLSKNKILNLIKKLDPKVKDATPGGSSGGSGAAVSADFCIAAIGTDTMGSVRVPAAYCGIVGFKPTRGFWSTEGVMPLSTTLDTIGPLTKTVGDAGLLCGHAISQVNLKTETLAVLSNFEKAPTEKVIAEF